MGWSQVSALCAHESASLGGRAHLLRGEGTEHGRLVRLILLAATRWPKRKPQDPWHSNETLAKMCGLTVNQAEQAISCLRRARVIKTRWGKRPKSKPGRLIAMGLSSPVKARAPSGFDISMLWTITGQHRARPAALVTMMVGAYMLASDAAKWAIDDWSELGCSAAALRRFIGQADGPSWTKRLRELEQLGLIRREGRRIEVSSPRLWLELAISAHEAATGQLEMRFEGRTRHDSNVALQAGDQLRRVAGPPSSACADDVARDAPANHVEWIDVTPLHLALPPPPVQLDWLDDVPELASGAWSEVLGIPEPQPSWELPEPPMQRVERLERDEANPAMAG